jgi:hypothetical protein
MKQCTLGSSSSNIFYVVVYNRLVSNRNGELCCVLGEKLSAVIGYQ